MNNSNSNPKVLAIIPARGGSKRILNKNLVDLCNNPLIYYSILAAKSSQYIDRIIVSTDEKRIAEVSETYGAEVLERPRNLALDNTPTIDVVIHVLDVLKEKNYAPNIIILLQPTSPLRTTSDIDNAIALFLNDDYESLISVCELEHPPFPSDNNLRNLYSLFKSKSQVHPLFDTFNSIIFGSESGTSNPLTSLRLPSSRAFE